MDRNTRDTPTHSVVLPKDDPHLVEHYSDYLALFPDACFVQDKHGTYRFKENKVVSWLLANTSLNNIVIAYQGGAHHEGSVSMDELMMLYQDIGYSLSGYGDVFGEEMADMQRRGDVLRAGANRQPAATLTRQA